MGPLVIHRLSQEIERYEALVKRMVANLAVHREVFFLLSTWMLHSWLDGILQEIEQYFRP